jgi:hypothetical protein
MEAAISCDTRVARRWHRCLGNHGRDGSYSLVHHCVTFSFTTLHNLHIAHISKEVFHPPPPARNLAPAPVHKHLLHLKQHTLTANTPSPPTPQNPPTQDTTLTPSPPPGPTPPPPPSPYQAPEDSYRWFISVPWALNSVCLRSSAAWAAFPGRRRHLDPDRGSARCRQATGFSAPCTLKHAFSGA